MPGQRSGQQPADGLEAIVAEALAAGEVQAFADRPVTGLSGGERARAAFARAYADWSVPANAAYRAHVALVDHVASKQAFADHAMARIQADLKRALDPAGILSPGNHGIG